MLESSDDPPSLSPQQQSQPEQETLSPQSRKSSRNQQLQSSEVLTNDVEVSERDIEEESPSGIIKPSGLLIKWFLESFLNYIPLNKRQIFLFRNLSECKLKVLHKIT